MSGLGARFSTASNRLSPFALRVVLLVGSGFSHLYATIATDFFFDAKPRPTIDSVLMPIDPSMCLGSYSSTTEPEKTQLMRMFFLVPANSGHY